MDHPVSFRRFGTMPDCSRNAVMTVDALKRWIDLTADLGYNCLLLYIEDTYEIEGEPYFGHLRGRYSEAELRAIDDYAFEKGMEVIPCIQTLAHLNALFHWPEYRALRDCDDILLAGDARVYALIEKMFRTFRRCLRTNVINVGMDEAHMLGRGRYMDEHGAEDRFGILLRHLQRVDELARQQDYHLIMWSDMFFRLASGGNYYREDTVISDEIRQKIPENVELIYWDYYSTSRTHYDRMLAAHESLKPGTWFAGGLWTWEGFTPHNRFSIESMGLALPACLEAGTQNVFMTLWGDDGAECSKFALLPALYYVAQLARGVSSPEEIRAGFEQKYGIPFDAFMLLDLPGTPNEAPGKVVNPDKYMFYCDCFMGQFDNMVSPTDAASYAACAEKLAAWTDHPRFGYLFRSQKALCETLAIKYDLGMRTRTAYRAHDTAALSALILDYDELLRRIDTFYDAFRALWLTDNKLFGFDVIDLRFGGVIQRVKHCRRRLAEHLAGTLPCIEELEQPVLAPGSTDFMLQDGVHAICYNDWSRNATACVI